MPCNNRDPSGRGDWHRLDYARAAGHYNGQEQTLTDNRPCRVVSELFA